MNNEIEVFICEPILQKLKENGKTVVWLAKQVGCDESNLRKTLKNCRYIHLDLLFRISVALEEDFFAYYSKQLEIKMNEND